MALNVKQEYDRLREAFRRRDQRRQNYLIATVVDTSPRAQYGFVVATLDEGTVVNVQCWSPVSLATGYKLFVAPMSNQPWNWYVLVGVNNSTDIEATPYLAPHPEPVSLATGVTGVLPTANQAKQTTRGSYVITTPAIAAGATSSGTTAGVSVAYVRTLLISGGTACTLQLKEASGGASEYATSSVGTPFTDAGGWLHSSDGSFHWSVTNDGIASASFAITLTVVAWEV